MFSNSSIRYQRTENDRYFALAGYSLLAAMWLTALLNYFSLPNDLPSAVDIDHKATGSIMKPFVLIVPTLVSVVFGVYSLMGAYVHKFRYKVQITEENAQEQYGRRLRIIRLANLCFALAGLLVTYKIIQHAKGNPQAFGMSFSSLMFLCLLPVPIYLMFGFMKKPR